MINSNINNRFNLILPFKHWVAVCFLLFLVAKPIVQDHLMLEDVKYELIETSENESPLDDKASSDLEDEVKYYDTNYDAFQLYTKEKFSNFSNPKAYLNYKLDILLPPPRI